MSNDKEQLSSKDLDFVADSKAAVLKESPRVAWLSLILIGIVVFVAIIWAAIAKVPIMTIGDGKIVPSARMQVIQNLEGGIVKSIEVSPGDVVKKGQVLLQLSGTRFASAYQEDLKKMAVLQARIARLTAESEGKNEVSFSAELKKAHPKLANSEIKLFRTNQIALKDKLETLRRHQQLTHQELKIIAPLVKKGVMSRLDKIRLERDLNLIKGQIQEKIDKTRSDAHRDLNKAEVDLALLKETVQVTKDRLQRTTIRSPVEGIVNKVYVTTLGEVIRPAMKIMDIVPRGEKLLIEARIKPSEIAFIHPGQKASIKVSAYDPSVYGSLDAKVVNISPDTIQDKEGNSFYEVLLKTDKNYLGSKEQPLSIIPGMTVTVGIMTGEKTILSYIFKPFLKAKGKALRER